MSGFVTSNYELFYANCQAATAHLTCAVYFCILLNVDTQVSGSLERRIFFVEGCLRGK